MASPKVSRKGIFGRFRVQSPDPTVSSFPSPPRSTVGSTITELAQENNLLRDRCEELTVQSQLNQKLFQLCSQNLLAKEDEVKDLQGQMAKLDELIVSLKEHIQRADHQDHHIELLQSENYALSLQIEKANTDYDTLIQNHKVEISNLQEKLRCAQADSDQYAKQFTAESGTLNALQTQCNNMQVELDLKHNTSIALELQVDFLATKVAQSTNAAHEREMLIVKLKTQLQQLVERHTTEQQSHAQQQQAFDNLYDMNKADHFRFESQFKAQNLTILSLQKKLDKAERNIDKVTVAYDDKVAELNGKLRRADLDLQNEIAKNTAWANFESNNATSKCCL